MSERKANNTPSPTNLITWTIVDTRELAESGSLEFSDTATPTPPGGKLFYRIGRNQ